MNLPDGVTLTQGRGGLDVLQVRTPAAECDVHLHGGHVTHFKPAGEEPVLFLSERAVFDGKKAIRGGIPICFPWFADRAGHPDDPAHGFARTAKWTLDAARAEGDVMLVSLMLRHDDDPAFGRLWPHPFEAHVQIRVGRTLDVRFSTRNVGDAPMTYEVALHTYLAVADVRRVALKGFDGATYHSKVEGVTKRQDGEPAIDGEIDRIYEGQAGTIEVRDPGMNRTIVVGTNESNVVLWNPHVEKAARMSDFGDDEWPRMLCVESGRIGDHAVTAGPGEWRVTGTSLEVRRG